MVTEVIEGSDLTAFVKGTKTIPTVEEARARIAEGNGGNGAAQPAQPIPQVRTAAVPPPPIPVDPAS
jgi:hypothetical protein